MDGTYHTRAKYPAYIPSDVPRAEPVTIHKPRTMLSFAETAALEQRARWEIDKPNLQNYAPHNLGKRASQETLDEWLELLAELPSPFIVLDAQYAMGCAKSATHNRMHMLEEKGMVRKTQEVCRPQTWEVVKKD